MEAPPPAAPGAWRIAVTGGLGAGKSLLCGWLAAAGHHVVDADALGRAVVAEEGLLARLVETFGEGIRDAAGDLDRRALARLAFATPAALARMDALVFPYLGRRLRDALAAAPGPCFVDAALIFEWGIEGWFDEVWVVRAAAPLRAARAAARLGLDPEEALARLAGQLPQEEKERRARRVLDNGGEPARLWEQAEVLLAELGLPGLDPRRRADTETQATKDPACPTRASR